MTQTLHLANASLALPDGIRRGSVLIRDGRIVAVDTGAAVSAGAVDCGGDLLAPGLIELHTDNLERHMTPRPKVAWPHRAAIVAHDAELAGTGITTVFDALRVGSLPSRRDGHPKYARALASEILALRTAGALKLSHFLHLRAEVCSETLLEEFAEFGPDDRVGIVSLMDHMPGQRQFSDLGKYRDYIAGRKGISTAEVDEYVAFLTDVHARHADRHGAGAVAEARRLGAVLASHDDTTVPQVAASAAVGARIAEFPTTTEAARESHRRGIAVMMGAPNLIRGASHSGNVAAGDLARLDLLDILSSDYVPAALLSAAVALGDLIGDRAAGLATVTSAPAAAVGLTDRGRIEVGLRADLVRIAEIGGVVIPHAVWVAGRQVA